MPQDDAAKAQIGLQVKELTDIAIADEANPKRHDLHEAACAHGGDGEFSKVTLDFDQPKYHRQIQPSALAFVPNSL
jgi:hypothetical protein